MKQWENIRFKTGEDYFNRTNTLFYLLVLGPMLAFAYFYLEAMEAEFTPQYDAELHQLMLIVLPIGALIEVVIVYVLFFRFRKLAREQETLRRKLQVLYRANLWKYIGLTSSTTIIAAGMYLTQQEVMGAWMAILFMLWSISVPTRQKFGRELKLSRDDRKIMVHQGEVPE